MDGQMMNGWTDDGLMDGQMMSGWWMMDDGWTDDGWMDVKCMMDGRMDGQMD